MEANRSQTYFNVFFVCLNLAFNKLTIEMCGSCGGGEAAYLGHIFISGKEKLLDKITTNYV